MIHTLEAVKVLPNNSEGERRGLISIHKVKIFVKLIIFHIHGKEIFLY